jgi:phosphate/sulfate permease
MEDAERQVWLPNITARTQLAAFLGGTFFAALLLYVSNDRMNSLFQNGDRLTIFTVLVLTATFTAFAFAAFALGLSSDMFRKSVQKNSTEYKKKAIRAFDTARDFFRIAYLAMLLSLCAVLANLNLGMGIVGGLIFILAWAYVVWKNHPYTIKEKGKK